MFTAPKLTNAGKALYYENLGGTQLRFTTIQMGKGALTGPIAAMTALVSPVVTITAAVGAEDGYVDVSGQFSNAALAEGFYWREIGVFAANPNDPDNRASDVLYCYQNAYDTADYIPLASVETVEKSITVPMLVGDAENVSCTLPASLINATKQDLDQHNAAEDAHSAKFDGKLDKTGDGGDVKVSFSAAEARSNVATGEKMSVLLGKIARYFADLGSAAFSAASSFAAAVHTHTKSQISDFPTLGTAAGKDAPASGNASTAQVVMGNDTRLTNARPASDVSAWAKAASKPVYTASEVGAAAAAHTHTKDQISDFPTLGTAAAKNVPTTGNASAEQVVMGSDSRMTNARPASDVFTWAKAANKPGYTAAEVGALPISGGTVAGDLRVNQYLGLNAWAGYGTGVAESWYDGANKVITVVGAEHIKLSDQWVWDGRNLPVQTANIELKSGWSVDAVYRPATAFRVGSMVFLEGYLTGGTKTKGTVIGTLPAGFRSSYFISLLAGATNAIADQAFRLRIASNGDIILGSDLTSAMSAIMLAGVCFLI